MIQTLDKIFVRGQNICPDGHLDKYFFLGQIVGPQTQWKKVFYLKSRDDWLLMVSVHKFRFNKERFVSKTKTNNGLTMRRRQPLGGEGGSSWASAHLMAQPENETITLCNAALNNPTEKLG